MTEKTAFTVTMTAGFLSVALIVWQGAQGASASWVYGFLAAFWSVFMTIRLMMLAPSGVSRDQSSLLSQKLIMELRARQEQHRAFILESALSSPFLFFLLACAALAGWQIFCAASPDPDTETLTFSLQQLDPAIAPAWLQIRLFEWSQNFLLVMGLCMMGFVLRSHAINRALARPMLIILASYAVSGYLTFLGLERPAGVQQFDLTGHGAGTVSYLLSTVSSDKPLTVFDRLLLENGLIGFALLTVICFIPLGHIALSAQNARSDKLVITCGLLIGLGLVLSVFLPFTPALGGFMTLCWMGLFLAWGAAENSQKSAFQK